MANNLQDQLLELKSLIDNQNNIVSQGKSRRPLTRKADYESAKAEYQKRRLNYLIDTIQNSCMELNKSINVDNPDNEKLIKIAKLALTKQSIKDNLPKLIELVRGLQTKSESKESKIQMPSNLPFEIKGDVSADFLELEKCYNSGCYRAATILCGRIIETCLHRKYYDVTGVDLLEKNPGIGLGKLIAKMAEKEIKLDPGLTQQIHLINQVRIYSVHRKSESFSPSKDQAYAMILYTLDVVEKIF